jgi:hypothetical protein
MISVAAIGIASAQHLPRARWPAELRLVSLPLTLNLASPVAQFAAPEVARTNAVSALLLEMVQVVNPHSRIGLAHSRSER